MATKKPVFKTAPTRMNGDSIELTPLEGKLIAILCVARDTKKTRFGERKMTHVAIVTEGAKEALEGIMFQTYFQELELDTWYIGKVARVDAGGNRAWVLQTDGLDKKAIAPLMKTVETVKLSGEDSGLLL